MYRSYQAKVQTEVKPISTGKTGRDLHLIDKACQNLQVPLVVVTDDVQLSNNAKVISAKQKCGNAVSHVQMMQYLMDCNINLIPVDTNRGKHTLCGLTSLLDAIAIGQPVIMSDNTNISIDIEKLKIGFTYKAGDLDDFKAKLNIFKQNPSLIKEYGDNARKYAEIHSYKHYCKQLYHIING